MLLRRLEYLIALEREGHFGRAAESCHLSQSALSSAIKKLEAELGVPIVRRGQRYEGLTPEGLEVLAWARRTLAEQAALAQRLSALQSGLTGTLRLGVIPTALPAVSRLTAPLRESHPDLRFEIRSMSARRIVAELDAFSIDAGMTYLGDGLAGLRTVPLYEERYLLLAPRRDSPAEAVPAAPATWADVAGAPLCLLTGEMQNRRIIEAELAAAGVSPHVVVETDSVSGVYDHLAPLGLASIVPHAWLASHGLPDGYDARPLPRAADPSPVGLVLSGSGPDPLVVQALLGVARDQDLARTL
ncbi:LysR family transcriptional regulator [Nocardioides sp. GY 10113]|uniref:LysR family transcriptional regulator n=1 Tax=Nocardioides sp. GY 10113 TaxID=2569761 RepID=UPI0010A81A5F|nr:LysR substrate-binding domain-containing protein [Nocardioides sp. GY 10113]TIC87711.1 LysR family transcriptional regulator [Nocardioides sp. GY 10113]